MNKVTLFLMSERGYLVLKEILSSFDPNLIDLIVLGRDKNVVTDYSKEILDLAKKFDVKIVDRTASYKVITPYALAISWRWLIRLDQKQTRLVVLHDSLLPKYRGFAPLVNQLIEKEPTLGVSAFFASEEFDKGDIIGQKSVDIRYPIKIKEAITITSKLYCSLVHNFLTKLSRGEELNTLPQKEEEATYSLWRDAEDYKIDWSQDASHILRFIHALGFPYLGAASELRGRVIRIFDAALVTDKVIVNRDYGKTIFFKEECPVVVCGKGLLKITEASYDDNGESIFPLENFRLRFK